MLAGSPDDAGPALAHPAIVLTARWDVSTLGSPERDWQEFWVLPYEDDYPVTGDFERPPLRGVKVVSHLPIALGCVACGWFPVSIVRDGQYAHVAMGTLADTPTIRPTAHIFVAAKAPWYEITDALPQYPGHVTE